MLFFHQKTASAFVFYLSALNLCRPFSRWDSLACRSLSVFLSVSCSIFQICGHDNLSKLNTLENTDTETISPFRFRLYWLFWFSLLYKMLVAMRIPAKITSSCIWVAIPVDWVVLHWYDCGADGRSLGRAVVYGHVINKFFWMGRLLHFLTHGAPLALFARQSSAIVPPPSLVKVQ